jgi:putative mycofactocin binding protein MftB
MASNHLAQPCCDARLCRAGDRIASGRTRADRESRRVGSTARAAFTHNRRVSTSRGARPVRLAPYVKFREENFGGVLFETRAEKVYTLNPTATAVIREIAHGDAAEIAGRLKDRYADNGAIDRETVAFIAELVQRGLLAE